MFRVLSSSNGLPRVSVFFFGNRRGSEGSEMYRGGDAARPGGRLVCTANTFAKRVFLFLFEHTTMAGEEEHFHAFHFPPLSGDAREQRSLELAGVSAWCFANSLRPVVPLACALFPLSPWPFANCFCLMMV